MLLKSNSNEASGVIDRTEQIRDLPTVRIRVFLKDRVSVYALGVFFLASLAAMNVFVLEGSSLTAKLVFLGPVALLLFGVWYLQFRSLNNVIEITPQFLRIDDCEFKEIPWSDIARIEVADHFSAQLGRVIHLILYLNNEKKYVCTRKCLGLSKKRSDGGVFATNLYDYSEDHRDIVKALSDALISSRLVCW